MKNKLLAALSLLLLLSSAAGCGETSVQPSDTAASVPTETEAPEQTEAPDVFDTIPADFDFGGAPFRIICTNDYNNYDERFIFAESENGELLNDTAVHCYTAVEERCNADIQIIQVNNGEIYTTIRPVIMAGEDAYDYLQFLGTRDSLASVIQGKMLYDLETIPTIDLSETCFFNGYSSNFNINGKSYIGFSAYINAGILPLYMVFNKNLMRTLDMEYPYQIIKDGKWTFDCFLSYIKDTAADLDGNGKMDWYDRYGYGNMSMLTNYLTFGFDVRTMKQTSDGLYEPDLQNEKLISAIGRILELRENPNCTPQNFDVKSADGTHYFMSGNALFSTTGTGSLVLRNITDFDFGIAPYPKYDETQEDYVSVIYPNPFGIPVTAQDTDRLGTVIHAMALKFDELMTPAMLDLHTEQKVLRDDESVEIALMMLHGQINVDITRVYNFDSTLELPSLLELIPDKSAIVSTISQKEAAAQAKAQKFFAGFIDE